MQSIISIFINFALVTVPEQIFLTIMILILVKKFGMLDIRMWRENLKWIMIPSILVSIIDNINSIFLSSKIVTIFNLILFYILITFIIKKNSDDFNNKTHKKIIQSFAFSFLILGFFESTSFPLMLFLLNKPLTIINNNGLWNFIATFPSRLLEYLLIIFLIIKNNNVVKFKLLDVIANRNILLIPITSFTIITNILAVYAIKFIGIDKILVDKVSIVWQIFISMSIIVVPAILLFYILVLINSFYVREKQAQQAFENLAMQDNVSPDVKN